MAVNVGVVGVGYLGQHHARIYAELDGVTLTAVVDADRDRAEKVAQTYGCRAYGDYREILGRIDALSIVTPTTTHFAIARECIDAGTDVLIEKPMTGRIEEADLLVEAAERTGVIVQVGHLERFNPAVVSMYPLIKEPRFLEAERMSPFLGRGIDVDITLDLMIHDIDIILAVLSLSGQDTSLRDVKATGGKILTDKIDMAKVWLEFACGVQALMTASRLSFDKTRRLRVFQRESYLQVDYQHGEIRRFSKGAGGIVQEAIPVEKKEPLREELRDFIDCVQKRRRPVVSSIEGRNALKIALRIGEQIAR